jgi:hypothetical protein
MSYFSRFFFFLTGVFGNELDRRKLIDTVANLIDVRKKVIMFCIENCIFFLVIFFI